MKLERTKNAARNIVFGGIQEIVNMLFPFVIRSVMLHYLGTQYLGLNGLFKSLLMFLNLAELGVGSAMVFSMYKPIAEDDTPAICALLPVIVISSASAVGIIASAIGIIASVALLPVLCRLIALGPLPCILSAVSFVPIVTLCGCISRCSCIIACSRGC